MTESPTQIGFVILGGVQVLRHGTGIDLGGPQSRSLLAMLLLAAGRPVPTAELVDALWAEDPPNTAVNMVHRTIGGLRRLLEPGLGPRENGHFLIRGSSGVRVQVTERNLDLLQFRSLVRRAERNAEVEGPVAALDPLVAALSLWKGTASAAIGARLGEHPAVVALDREYLSVARDAADAALAANEPDRVLAEIRRAPDLHLLDESLQARLMLLLAAAGQQAEALSLFEKVKERLADGLGVDPGPELRLAHRSVLRSSAEPAESRIAVAARMVGRPAQLPPSLSSFVGRQSEMTRILEGHQRNRGAAHIQIIGGMAGAGKTTLAVQAAHVIADRYPDGQLYVNLRGFDRSGRALGVPDALAYLLGSIGVKPADIPESVEARTAELRSRLWSRRILLLLDNAREVEQVRPLLPGGPGCMVIVTSRDSLMGLVAIEGASLVRLDRMPDIEARDMLTRRLDASWAAEAPEAVSEIVAMCSALPLALAIVASRAAAAPEMRATDVAAELRRSHGSLDAFTLPSASLDARGVFSWSYHLLTPVAARLFRSLAVHPGPHLGVPAAASILGEPVTATRAALDELTAAQLISASQLGRFQMHDLLRVYAGELVRMSPDEERAARLRMLNYYLHSSYNGDRLLNPQRRGIEVEPLLAGVVAEVPRSAAEVHAWREAEAQIVIGVVMEAVQYGHDRYIWQLAWSLSFLRDVELVMLEGAAAAAERLQDLPILARLYAGLGAANARAHRLDEADRSFKQALEIQADLQDDIGQGLTHMAIAEAYCRYDRIDVAEDHTEKAAAFSRRPATAVADSLFFPLRPGFIPPLGGIMRPSRSAVRS